MPKTEIASDTITYHNRLREAREHAGISQNKLEELSGVGKPVIWKIEKSNHWPTEDVRVRLAQALNCNAGWLFYAVGQTGGAKKR